MTPECKEPFRFVPFEKLQKEGKHLGKAFPTRWEDYVVMTQGDFTDAGEYVENTRHHYWLPFVLRTVNAINDCVKKVYTGLLGKPNRLVIGSFVRLCMAKGKFSNNIARDRITAYQFPKSLLEGEMPPEEGYVGERIWIGVAFKPLEGDTQAMDLPMIIDWNLLKLLKLSYAEYQKNHP